jgi:hypothetical protein
MLDIPLRFFFFYSKVPQSYEDSLKPSVIIPTPVLERESDKYNNNNISNLSMSNSSANVTLKIEEVSNETSNLMIEDRQQNTTTTRWGGKSEFGKNFRGKVGKLDIEISPLSFNVSFNWRYFDEYL